MKFFTDSYVRVGYRHLAEGGICQDYSDTYSNEDEALIVVSDGCSTGGRTDIGSRMITMTTIESFKRYGLSNKFFIQNDVLLNSQKHILGLNVSDFYATRLFSYLCKDKSILSIEGDGIVAIKFKSGLVVIHRVEWMNNTPFYPAYCFDGLLDSFIQAQGGDLNSHSVKIEHWDYLNESFGARDTKRLSLGDSLQPVEIPLSVQDLDTVIIFSDGITQIDGIDWKEAVVKCLNFKNYKGSFVKRRLIRFMKDTIKTGKGPIDDFSCAAIKVYHDE